MMTLEAAVILPLLLVATVLVFWTGILLYDRCAVQSAVSAAVLRGVARSELENDALSALVREVAADWMEGRLVLMEAPQLTVTVDHSQIRASISGELRVPALPFYGSAAWAVNASAEARRLRESQIVRTIRRIDRMMEGAR